MALLFRVAYFSGACYQERFSCTILRTTCQKVKILDNSFQVMQKCSRCNNDVKVTYSCDHTNNLETCSECYQQLHWEMT